MMAAIGRAGDLIHHGPRALLGDWLAWPFVGTDADAILASNRPVLGDLEAPFVTWLAARSRLAEDWLAASGADQYVILGAGLDSFAWRQDADVRVFEVDHPSTQAWKQARVASIGLPVPAELVWVPVDFERQRLGPALSEAGLDTSRAVFVSWLGVIPYLTRDAIIQTLQELPRCQLALGYLPPRELVDEDARQLCTTVEAIARETGEPWITSLSPAQFAAMLTEGGFTVTDDVGAHDIEGRYGRRALNYERMALARKER
jgi:methyltransferase (TIGR00027 family)